MIEKRTAQKPSVAVISSKLPFADGGAERLAGELVAQLRHAGHLCDLVWVPQNPFGRQLAAYLAARCTSVTEDASGRPVELAISLRYPAYAVRHPRHVVWLTHRMREYYDLWPQFYGRLAAQRSRAAAWLRRTAIRTVDRHLLKARNKRVFCISGQVAERLRRWGGIRAEVLYPPPPERAYHCLLADPEEPLFVAVSRLQPLKRLELFVAAFAHLRGRAARGVVIGDGPHLGALRQLVAQLGLTGIVRIETAVDDHDLTRYYAQSLGVVFTPYQEDFGFVTLESFRSGKPVITCCDSGGPVELVKHAESGFIVAPAPEAVAAAMIELLDDRERARTMGANGLRAARTISWERVIEALTTCFTSKESA